MIRIFGYVAVLSGLLMASTVTESRAGYLPDAYVYHRHDHYHYLVPPAGWYYRHPPAYYFEYRYRPRLLVKKKQAGKRTCNSRQFYCSAPWRNQAKMEKPRTWYPYFNPRPTKVCACGKNKK